MYIIYNFEGKLNVTRFDNIEFDAGHIILTSDLYDLISTDTISYGTFTYIAWSLKPNLINDLSNYNFIECED